MQTLFSEVLTKDDWLKLWDNIFSNHPSFPIFFIVAYLIANRQTLLSTNDIDDFKVRFKLWFLRFVFELNVIWPVNYKSTFRYSICWLKGFWKGKSDQL